MERAHKGIAFVQKGSIYCGLRTRDGKRRAWVVAQLAPPPPGVELSIEWARIVSRKLQDHYDKTGELPSPVVARTDEPQPSTLTMIDAARRWIATLPEAQAIDDGRRIEAYLSRAALGAIPLPSVTSADLRAFVAWLLVQPSKRGGTLAPRTVRNAFDVVRRMLSWASSEDVRLIDRSPCTDTPSNLPAIEDKHREFRANAIFSRTEALALVTDERIPEDRRVLYALLLLTGCRVGEIAALRWRHWNTEAQPLSRLLVANSIERETREEKSTKTGVARQVPVHPSLARILQAWKRSGWLALFGREPTSDDFVIPSRDGDARSTRHAHNKLQDDLQRLGFRPRRVHDFRRSLITFARDDGARSDVLKHITHGMSKSSMLDVYSSLAWSTYCGEVSRLRFELDSEGTVTTNVTHPPPPPGGETKNAIYLAINGASYGRGGRDLNPAESSEVSPTARNCSTVTDGSEPFATRSEHPVTLSVTRMTLDVRRVLAEETERGFGWSVDGTVN